MPLSSIANIRAVTGVPALVDELLPIASEIQSIAFDPNARTTGYSTGFAHASSTFSGHGGTIGQAQNFDTLSFRIYPHDAAYLPTLVRVLVRETDHTGTVLADVVVPIECEWKIQRYIQAHLGVSIANASNLSLYAEYYTNGRCGYENVFPVFSDSPRARYSSSGSISVMTTNANSSAANHWFSIENTGTRNVGQTAVPYTIFAATSSTYTGWGCPVGVMPKFNRLQFVMNAWNTALLPTQVRVRVRSVDQNGAILASAMVAVSFTAVGNQAVTVDFPTDVDPNGSQCWFEFMSDGGQVSFLTQITTDYTSPGIVRRYVITGSIESVTSTAGSGAGIWLKWMLIDRQTQRRTLPGALRRFIRRVTTAQAVLTFSPSFGMSLPSRIPCVQGFESNIYWDGLFRSWIPSNQYNIDIASSYGRQDSERWRFTPAGGDVGTQSLIAAAGYDGTTLASQTASLIVKANTVGSGITRKVLVIGDSTTATGTPTQQILDNLAADSTTYATTLIGTQGTGSNKHEGRSGTSISWWYTNASSPMVFAGVFNFAQYLTINSLTMSSGDSVFILLGINDVAGSSGSGTVFGTLLSTMSTKLSAMITSIQAAVSGVKVWVGLTIPPSRSQDSFGTDYGSGNTRDQHAYSVASWRERVLLDFDGRTGSNIYVAPISLSLDTLNNMSTVSEAANARNATLVTRQSNGVHPAASGYQQIGDCLYCCLMSLES